MAKVNINREVTDAFYRYKMPAKIVAKVEGKGNGVRTVLPNLHDIAKALERPSVYLLKFFGAGSRNSDSNGETIPTRGLY